MKAPFLMQKPQPTPRHSNPLTSWLTRDRWIRIIRIGLPVVVLWGMFLFFANWGIDFGTEWEEHTIIDRVYEAFSTGNLLPHFYFYPSVPYEMVYLALVRKMVAYVLAHFPTGARALYTTWEGLRAQMLTIDWIAFYLSARKVFILATSLTVVWVYFLTYRWRSSVLEATAAAAAMLGSWQYLYHSRWVAPDAVMAMFAIAALTCLCLAMQGKHWNSWIKIAAIAAGLTFSSKYPGGLVLVPILVACLLDKQNQRLRSFLKVIVLFAVTFYITTPGAFWELTNSLESITRVYVDYTQSGGPGYNVTPGWQHFSLMLTFLGGAAFSRYLPVAIGLAVLGLIGIVSVVHEKDRFGLMLVLFLMLFLGYFSTVTVMTIRNILVTLPVIAVLIGRGVGSVYRWIPAQAGKMIPAQAGKWVFASVLAGCLLINFGWQFSAANSIRTDGGDRGQAQAALSYIQKHPTEQFWVSRRVQELILDEAGSLPANLVSDETKADLFVYHSNDVSLKSITLWQGDRIDYTVATFGPYEMDFNYYPSWAGRSRIVVMRPKYALPLLSIVKEEK
jgi:4-amino-4-deoxy-L-arabinose transferase-like glycosyltransferase